MAEASSRQTRAGPQQPPQPPQAALSTKRHHRGVKLPDCHRSGPTEKGRSCCTEQWGREEGTGREELKAKGRLQYRR